MSATISFLKCITLMTISLASKDVSKAKPVYPRWEEAAQPFLKKFGLVRDFNTISKRFKATYEFTEDEGEELGLAMKAKLPEFVKDTSISKEELAMLRDITTFFRKDSEPCWNRINKNSVILGAPALSALFLDRDSKEVGDLATSQKMAKIVLALTDRKDDPVLSLKEILEFRKTDAKLIEQYSKLRMVFTANYKKCLQKFVRISGHQTVDVETARNYLKAMGCNYLPTGFVGRVDEQGKFYTTEGKLLKGGAVGIIKMNPAYDPKTDNTYYCWQVDNKPNPLRTVNFLKANTKGKFEVVGEFMEDVDMHHETWLKDLDSLDARIQMHAVVVEAMFQSQARIGGEKNKNDGQQTYGMTTVKVGQVHATTDGLDFEYPGKKGTMQHHFLSNKTPTNRKVIRLIRGYMKNKTKDKYVFTIKGALLRPDPVNKYLKAITGIPKMTAHKIRHAAGTKLALKKFATSPFKKTNPPSQSAAEKWAKEQCLEIGAMLHHRSGTGEKEKTVSTTSINSYIDPDVITKFFTDLGLRRPSWLPLKDD